MLGLSIIKVTWSLMRDSHSTCPGKITGKMCLASRCLSDSFLQCATLNSPKLRDKLALAAVISTESDKTL